MSQTHDGVNSTVTISMPADVLESRSSLSKAVRISGAILPTGRLVLRNAPSLPGFGVEVSPGKIGEANAVNLTIWNGSEEDLQLPASTFKVFIDNDYDSRMEALRS